MQIKYKDMGKDSIIYPYVVISNPEVLSIKSKVILSEFIHIVGKNPIIIGNFVHIAPFTSIIGGGGCIIEDFCGISSGVRIVTGTERTDGSGISTAGVSIEFRSIDRNFIHLKKHSFLGTNSIIMPGVTVGEGCVIGAGALVTKDTEPWSIYIGTPAKKIKERDNSIIKEMEKNAYINHNIEPYDSENDLKYIKEILWKQ